MDPTQNIRAAEVAFSCMELDETLKFFVNILGFRVDTIFPADHPSVAVISGYGMRIRLQGNGISESAVLRLECDDPGAVAGGQTRLAAPGGIAIDLVQADAPVVVPPNEPSFVVSRMGEKATWNDGRAGMRYRDLIPDRQGGRFIASHIRILKGGEVPDYVHFHKIRFQMIYCYKGWVRVVYQDQGPPFVLKAGDCVLQPPQIRHRVLKCSPGLEVIEVGCPAEHPTHADHELTLPTKKVRVYRDFHGQRFARHVARDAEWHAWRTRGFEARDTGIADATDGFAGARVVRPVVARDGSIETGPGGVEAEFLFTFVLQGSLSLQREGHVPEHLEAGDCFTMPAGECYGLMECSEELEFLEVTLPAVVESS